MKKLAYLCLLCWLCANAARADDGIRWTNWSPAVFAQAKREHRFVLLDLEAVWCHWCHVMDVNTYSRPAVIALVKSNYIAVRVDQDARPDLAARYEDYGWPATIVFNADGGEIVKRQGYLPPGEMTSMLKAIIADPSPGPTVHPAPTLHFQPGLGLTPALRESVKHKLIAGYDAKMGGWGFEQKYLNCDNVEYCLAHAREKDAPRSRFARQTLHAQLQLIDPAWGGVYQYSTDDDWKHPHFEKIMSMQAGDLRIYALAYTLWGDRAYLLAAQAIDRYLRDFLTSPDGAFYTSQDADLVEGQHSSEYFKLDDADRRNMGIPRVDRHIYAREKGWAIDALAEFSCVTGDSAALNRALRAAEWIRANRALSDGGFRHDSHDVSGPYLGDTLAMARAFLTLYEASADRAWLASATQAADFISKTFAAQPGFNSAIEQDASFAPHPDYEENVQVARFANMLFYYTGRKEYRTMAESAVKWTAAPEIAGRRFSDVGGVLLADEELNNEPVHLTVVGRKNDPQARALWDVARKIPTAYRRLEWFDPNEGPLPSQDVPYPTLPYAAAFFCDHGVCSSPITNADALSKKIAQRVE